MSVDKPRKAKAAMKARETEEKLGDVEKHGGAHGKDESLATIREV